MNALTADRLRGTWCTLLLPVNADDSIDYGALANELDFLCNAGISGIYSNGTAGEFFNQTEAEFDRVSLMLAEKCHQTKTNFQIGACHMSPVISLERIRRTLALQPGAYQVILPDWVILNEREEQSFFEKIANEAGSVPLVLYSPGHAKTKLAPMDFKRISELIPELIGIKTGGGNPAWYQDMRNLNMNLSVFVPGHRLATGMSEKVASGAYSNVACLNPMAAQRWYEQMLTDPEGALSTEKRVLEFFDKVIFPFHTQGYSDMALDKFLAAIGGWADIGTRLRWPYESIDASHVKAAREIATTYLPEFFE